MKKQSVFINYVIKNKKNFLLILILFLIGVMLGIFFINNSSSSQKEEINKYVSKLVGNIKSYENINKTELIYISVIKNTGLILLVWFLGCTIIGSIFIFVTIIYRGFSLGYTISAIIACLGVRKGTLFTISALFMQNIIFLPAFFMLCESGIKLYNGICKHCINLRIEVIRHTIIMLFAIILAVIASIIEVYFSTKLLFFLKDFL